MAWSDSDFEKKATHDWELRTTEDGEYQYFVCKNCSFREGEYHKNPRECNGKKT
jgi:hypothetical protein